MSQLLQMLKNRYALNVSRVVQNYDDFLQYALITTTSFPDIINGKLNQRNRSFQLTTLIYLFVYFFPKYFTLYYLYAQDEQTRQYYQYYLADYAEELGLLGRTFNICYSVFSFEIALNIISLRWFESKGSLEYLTDWMHRTPRYRETSMSSTFQFDFDDKMRHQLMSQLHFKTVIGKILASQTNLAICSYETVGFVLFLYKRRPGFLVSCLATFNWSTVLLFFKYPGHHFHALYLSFVAVTDYFALRINRMIEKSAEIKASELTDQSLTQVLNDYDQLISVFNKYNKVLKHLLRNLIQFYVFGLTASFFVFTVKTEPWMSAFIVTSAAGYSLIILATGLYISQLHGAIFLLQKHLASIPAKHSKNKNISLKNLFRLRLVIKELGSLETDGQFVVGLRDGEGAAISRIEIFELTMTTLGNILMLMKFVQQVKV